MKVSYLSSECLVGESSSGVVKPTQTDFPDNFSTDGYIFVMDASKSQWIDDQLSVFRECVSLIDNAKPVVVVLSKGDLVDQLLSKADYEQMLLREVTESNPFVVNDAMRQAYMARIARLEWFTVSARKGINVDEPFLYIAAAALELPGRRGEPTPYTKAVALRAANVELMKQKLGELVQRVVNEQEPTSFRKLLGTLVKKPIYQEFVILEGSSAAKREVEANLTKLEKDEAKLGAFAKNTHSPQMQRKFPAHMGGSMKAPSDLDRRSLESALATTSPAMAVPARPPKPKSQQRHASSDGDIRAITHQRDSATAKTVRPTSHSPTLTLPPRPRRAGSPVQQQSVMLEMARNAPKPVLFAATSRASVSMQGQSHQLESSEEDSESSSDDSDYEQMQGSPLMRRPKPPMTTPPSSPDYTSPERDLRPPSFVARSTSTKARGMARPLSSPQHSLPAVLTAAISTTSPPTLPPLPTVGSTASLTRSEQLRTQFSEEYRRPVPRATTTRLKKEVNRHSVAGIPQSQLTGEQHPYELKPRHIPNNKSCTQSRLIPVNSTSSRQNAVDYGIRPPIQRRVTTHPQLTASASYPVGGPNIVRQVHEFSQTKPTPPNVQMDIYSQPARKTKHGNSIYSQPERTSEHGDAYSMLDGKSITSLLKSTDSAIASEYGPSSAKPHTWPLPDSSQDAPLPGAHPRRASAEERRGAADYGQRSLSPTTLLKNDIYSKLSSHYAPPPAAATEQQPASEYGQSSSLRRQLPPLGVAQNKDNVQQQLATIYSSAKSSQLSEGTPLRSRLLADSTSASAECPNVANPSSETDDDIKPYSSFRSVGQSNSDSEGPYATVQHESDDEGIEDSLYSQSGPGSREEISPYMSTGEGQKYSRVEAIESEDEEPPYARAGESDDELKLGDEDPHADDPSYVRLGRLLNADRVLGWGGGPRKSRSDVDESTGYIDQRPRSPDEEPEECKQSQVGKGSEPAYLQLLSDTPALEQCARCGAQNPCHCAADMLEDDSTALPPPPPPAEIDDLPPPPPPDDNGDFNDPSFPHADAYSISSEIASLPPPDDLLGERPSSPLDDGNREEAAGYLKIVPPSDPAEIAKELQMLKEAMNRKVPARKTEAPLMPTPITPRTNPPADERVPLPLPRDATTLPRPRALPSSPTMHRRKV